MLLNQLGNRTQCFVHLLRSSEFLCHVRFKYDNIGSIGILCRVLSAYTFAEVVLRAH